VTGALLSKLRRLLTEMSSTSDRRARGQDVVREAARFVRANVAFHKTLVSAAGSPLLDRLYAQLQLQHQIVTYMMHRGFDPKAAAQRQREHEGIVAALETRNARLLKARLEAHAAASEGVILGAPGVAMSRSEKARKKRGTVSRGRSPIPRVPKARTLI
jgi:DNA-binding GntR family transcriptional regulator